MHLEIGTLPKVALLLRKLQFSHISLDLHYKTLFLVIISNKQVIITLVSFSIV